MLESNTRLKSVVESVQKRKQEDKDKKEDKPKEEKIRECLYNRGESSAPTTVFLGTVFSWIQPRIRTSAITATDLLI